MFKAFFINKFSHAAKSKRKGAGQNHQSGQVAIEYMLLLVVVVALYVSIMSMMTKRDPNGDPDSSGFIIKAWDNIITTIGLDHADDTN